MIQLSKRDDGKKTDDPLFRFRRVRQKEEIEVCVGRSFAALVMGCLLLGGSLIAGGANLDWLAAALQQIVKAWR